MKCHTNVNPAQIATRFSVAHLNKHIDNKICQTGANRTCNLYKYKFGTMRDYKYHIDHEVCKYYKTNSNMSLNLSDNIISTNSESDKTYIVKPISKLKSTLNVQLDSQMKPNLATINVNSNSTNTIIINKGKKIRGNKKKKIPKIVREQVWKTYMNTLESNCSVCNDKHIKVFDFEWTCRFEWSRNN